MENNGKKKMLAIGEGERRLLMEIMAGMPSEIKKKIERSDERYERLREMKAPKLILNFEKRYNEKLRRQLKNAERELNGDTTKFGKDMKKLNEAEMWDVTRLFGTKNVKVNRGGSVEVSAKKVEGKALRDNSVSYVLNRQSNGEVYIRRNVLTSAANGVKLPGQYVIHRNPKTGEYNGFKTVRDAADWLFWYGMDLQKRAAKKK